MNVLRSHRRRTGPQITNFYYSFLFLPREKREAIEAVYAFARRGDDLADGNLTAEEAGRGICFYRQALASCYGADALNALDGNSVSPELRRLASAVCRYKIPRQHFEDLILGLEMDLRMEGGTPRYETFEDLALYCYRVASTIGLISIEVFGYRNPQTRDYAVNLGMALQLVNILRDLQSDAKCGRIYLPREDLERFGVRPEELACGGYTDRFIELMRFESDRARHYFGEARKNLAREDRRSMIAAEIMAAIYWGILRRIRARAYNVFGERVRLSRQMKFWTALSVRLGAEWMK